MGWLASTTAKPNKAGAINLEQNTYLRNACVTWCARLLGRALWESCPGMAFLVSTNIKNCDEKDSIILTSTQVQCTKRQWDYECTKFSLQF